MHVEQPERLEFANDFRAGEWLVEPSLDRLSRNGTVLHIRPQLIDLLVVLAQHAGRTVSKDVILAKVWEGQHVAESGLTRCIAEIRQVLADDARDPTMIQTIPKRGYRLVAPVEFLKAHGMSELGENISPLPVVATPAYPIPEPVAAPTRSEPPPESATDPPGPQRLRRRVGLTVGSIFSVTLLLALAWGASGWTRVPVLSTRDTVLLADVTNTTGDGAFDGTLRLALAVHLSLLVTAAGQHTIKAGVQFERIGNDVADYEQKPHVYLNWNQSWTTLAGEQFRGQYGYWSWREFGTMGKVTVDNLGLFVQDAWTVNSKLTMNLGIRTENETVPSYRANLSGIKFSFADKLAPRVGFAYDIKGNGKWKVYGSWGVFYDVMKLELPRGAFGGDVWVQQYYKLDTLDWNTLMVNNNKPGQFLETVDLRIPSNDPSCPLCGGIDPNLKPFRQQELVFGVEHELSPRIAVSARYVHKQVDRAIEDVGVMEPGFGEVFFIANPGEGVGVYLEKKTCPTCPGLPKIKRDYDALELKLTRRFADNWMFNASYTLSRLYGNYPGLASSDEIARVAPNVTRLFDGVVMAFDETGQPTYGRLNTDRPHQFKFSGAYQLPTKTAIGGVWRAASGIPISRTANMVSSTRRASPTCGLWQPGRTCRCHSSRSSRDLIPKRVSMH